MLLCFAYEVTHNIWRWQIRYYCVDPSDTTQIILLSKKQSQQIKLLSYNNFFEVEQARPWNSYI